MIRAHICRRVAVGGVCLAVGLVVGCGVEEYEKKMSARRELLKDEVKRNKFLGPAVVPPLFPMLSARAPKQAKRVPPPPGMTAAFEGAQGDAPVVLYIVGEQVKKGGVKKLSSPDAFIGQVRGLIGQTSVVQDFVLKPKSQSVKITSLLLGKKQDRQAVKYLGDGTLLVAQADGRTAAKPAGFQIYVLRQSGVQAALVYGYDRSKAQNVDQAIKYSVGSTWVGADAVTAKTGGKTALPVKKASDDKKEAKPADVGPDIPL